MLFQPLVRQSLFDRVFIVRPGVLLAVIEETHSSLIIILIIQFALDIFPIFQAHTIVLLAALAAKYQRQEHTLAITGYVLLPLQCQKAFMFLLERGVDHITFAD